MTPTLVIPIMRPVAELEPLTAVLAAQLDDLETTRMAMANRVRILTQPKNKPDEDGVCRGFGLDARNVNVARVDGLLHGAAKRTPVTLDSGEKVRASVVMPGLADLEAEAVKHLVSEMNKSAWGPWLTDAPGVGAKTLARLLAATGDPRWNYRDDAPRTLSQLRAYVGMHVMDDGIAARRVRGGTSNWNAEARKRLWVLAQGCIKVSGGRYRETYDATRVHYADAVHAVDCVRCGPKGKPALAGSPLSKAHQHGRATRAIMKHVLRDLWLEARRQHGEDVSVEAPEPGLREPV